MNVFKLHLYCELWCCKLVSPETLLDQDILVCTETLLDPFEDVFNSLGTFWIVISLDDHAQHHHVVQTLTLGWYTSEIVSILQVILPATALDWEE
jgi:hypothetical protein